MATNYTELVDEIKTWLDRDDTVLDTVIPTFIRFAESSFSRELHTREMECRLPTPLVPEGVADEDRGIYDLPPDWGGHKTVERIGDELVTTYWQRIPNLDAVTVTTNWLLDKYPDLYLYASLSHAEPFLKNDPRAALWSNAARQILAEVVEHDEHDRFSGGPIRSRMPGERPWRHGGSKNEGRMTYLVPYEFYDLKFASETDADGGCPSILGPGYFTVTEDFIKIWPLP